jgi:inorganic pyrophosphatase
MRLHRIPALVKKRQHIRAIIETPRGSRLKYYFDPKLNQLVLDKTLPEGMSFPYDFGFIPGTKGEDGDPLDVLVLMDVPALPCCVAECRIIGAIEAEQTERDGTMIRNDRFLAVVKDSLAYERIHDTTDLPARFSRQLEEFFVTYNKLEGRKFQPIRLHGARYAWKLLQRALNRRSRKS